MNNFDAVEEYYGDSDAIFDDDICNWDENELDSSKFLGPLESFVVVPVTKLGEASTHVHIQPLNGGVDQWLVKTRLIIDEKPNGTCELTMPRWFAEIKRLV